MIDEQPFDFEEPEPIRYESDEEQFEQQALFSKSEFKSPGPEKYRFENAEELLELGEFSDSRFWEALNRERKKRGLDG